MAVVAVVGVMTCSASSRPVQRKGEAIRISRSIIPLPYVMLGRTLLTSCQPEVKEVSYFCLLIHDMKLVLCVCVADAPTGYPDLS